MRELNSVSASEHIQALYRLLLIRTGQRFQAEQALRETLTQFAQNNLPDRSKTDFVEYYRAALRTPTSASGPLRTDLDGWSLALHHLPEPQRSAITLFYLEIFSPRALSELLGLNMVELANLITAARNSLDGEQPKSTIA